MIHKEKITLGVFDSGFGGVSVLNELIANLSQVKFLYYADLAHSPYGEKSSKEVFELTSKACDYLISQACDAILVACNTATSVAIESLRQKYSLPIFGMEPAIKPALFENPSNLVAVLATSLTLREDKFMQLKYRLNGNSRILPIPCNGLAKLIDLLDFDGVERFVSPILNNLDRQNISVSVLGCTHYVLVKYIIQKLSPNLRLYDGNIGTVKHIAKKLDLSFQSSSEVAELKIYLNTQNEKDYLILKHYLQNKNREEIYAK